MGVRTKILIPVLLLVFAATFTVGFISINKYDSLIITMQRDNKTVTHRVAELLLEQKRTSATEIALLVSENELIVSSLQNFLKNSRSESSRDELLSTASHLAASGGVDFLTITDAEGAVILRTHEPKKFGDNLRKQANIQKALAGTQYTTIETGTEVKLSLRSGAPVLDERGKVIAAVSTGFRLDQEKFVDELKRLINCDVTVFLGDTRIMTTVINNRGERLIDTKAAEHISKQVLGGTEYIGNAVVGGKQMIVHYTPIRNFENEVIGMFFTGNNIAHVLEGQKSIIVFIVIVTLAICILAAFIIFNIVNGITVPLKKAANVLNEISRGHLSVRLNLNRSDEIGVMANEVDHFADNLQHTVIDSMTKISEGDFNINVEATDSKDEISAAIKNTVDALRMLIIDDGGKVLQAAAAKDLSQRLTHGYKGEYAKMKDNINTVVATLDEAMGQVSEAVSQVTSASGEISSGAKNLAESASEQTSSLEEVSSSLEEMSSMTKQNADNSNQAKILASETRNVANDGDAAMKRMANAINQIKQSSDNTAKIIKTIDDIAFQTNLLALNAAVEAARAGEAGKGFAVVAEEVRNLAMRSAEAAKNTANMIEESVKNADGGVKITEEVAKSLGQIVDRASKVGDLIAEIAAASNEQALGIEQVNTAVAQMNQVTQQTAANSKDSASASEELGNQAANLANMVSAFKINHSIGTGKGLAHPVAKLQLTHETIPLDDGDLAK